MKYSASEIPEITDFIRDKWNHYSALPLEEKDIDEILEAVNVMDDSLDLFEAVTEAMRDQNNIKVEAAN